MCPRVCSLTHHTAAYVTCQDLRSIVDPSEQMVMVIKAPPETQLQVSDPAEVSVPGPPVGLRSPRYNSALALRVPPVPLVPRLSRSL